MSGVLVERLLKECLIANFGTRRLCPNRHCLRFAVRGTKGDPVIDSPIPPADPMPY